MCVSRYLETKKDELLRPDIGCHSVWYAVCQGMMYIVVFHHKALLEMENGEFYRHTNLHSVILALQFMYIVTRPNLHIVVNLLCSSHFWSLR